MADIATIEMKAGTRLIKVNGRTYFLTIEKL
jgi:hypothetical protein